MRTVDESLLEEMIQKVNDLGFLDAPIKTSSSLRIQLVTILKLLVLYVILSYEKVKIIGNQKEFTLPILNNIIKKLNLKDN